jgi:nicotinamide riboside kinase
MKYQNVYFINGNAYAGKSTIVKKLVEKYNGILCEENYHDQLQDTLDKKEFPALTYTRDLQDWGDFIRRTPDEYEEWINKVTEECAIIELKILNELVKKNKKIFVDTNIPVSMLKKISDKDHVLIMLTDPNESVNRFFDRPDLEKQFLYQLLLKEENPNLAIENFKNCLKRINSIENYNKFYTSGFNVLIKDESRSIDETLEIVEKYFKLK